MRRKKKKQKIHTGRGGKVHTCLSKHRYLSEVSANNAATILNMRAYKCDICEGYHLTKAEIDWDLLNTNILAKG
jgi:hypothetical protein